MHVHCRSCGSQILADDMNLLTGIAKCRSCHAVFRFDIEPELAGGGSSRSRARVETPGSINRDLLGGQLTFRHRWFSWKIVFMTFFCLIWNGFLVLWYTFALVGDAPLVFKLFPLIHVAVGVGLTYYTICGYVNSTTVTLDRGHLTVKHGPLPWPGNLDLDASQLRQLYCEEKMNRGKNGVHFTYNLMALTRDGGRKKLLSNLDAPDVPLYMEQEMEEWLKIRDEPVQGEMRR